MKLTMVYSSVMAALLCAPTASAGYAEDYEARRAEQIARRAEGGAGTWEALCRLARGDRDIVAEEAAHLFTNSGEGRGS